MTRFREHSEAAMLQFFGDPWPSGLCDEGERVATPVGAPCLLCGVDIAWDDQGSFMYDVDGMLAPTHRECSLRSVLGGIGHLEDHALWCGQNHDPDGGRSYRQSALEVWEWVQTKGLPE